MQKKLWRDVEIGDKFVDGSTVTQIHETHIAEGYKLILKESKLIGGKDSSIVASADHLFLADISKLKKEFKEYVLGYYATSRIPVAADLEMLQEETNDKIYTEEEISEIGEKLRSGEHVDGFIFYEKVVKDEPAIADNSHVWLSTEFIFELNRKYNCKILINGFKVKDVIYKGSIEARCISTDTGRYEVNNAINHNSVSLRNIILHVLTHSQKYGLALVDIKMTEFSPYKGMEGVVGVANSVKETVELLRVARDLMYKRQSKMAELDIVDINDHVPVDLSDDVWVSGRRFNKDQPIEVRDPETGEEKTMTAREIAEYLS